MKHKRMIRLIAGMCCLALLVFNGMEVMMAYAEPSTTRERKEEASWMWSMRFAFAP